MMPAPLSWIVGGVIGGAIGAVIWAALAYYLNVEVGWVAIGIGVLVGLGVRIGSSEPGGLPAGGLAAIIALLAIAGGKYAAVKLDTDSFYNADDTGISAIAYVYAAEQGVTIPSYLDDANTLSDFFPPSIWNRARSTWAALSQQDKDDYRISSRLAYSEYVVSYIADEVCRERAENGEDVNDFDWPGNSSFEMAFFADDYPTDIWQEAKARWDSLPESEQVPFQQSVREMILQEDSLAGDAFEDEVVSEGFFATLGMFDVLWAVLAVASAYKIGSGQSREE